MIIGISELVAPKSRGVFCEIRIPWHRNSYTLEDCLERAVPEVRRRVRIRPAECHLQS
jgi:hypothetical protein